MISVYQIKPKFQQLLKPLLGIFHKVGITANGITWMAILLSTAIGVLFWFFPNGHMLWIFVAITGFIGDVVVSAIKRDIGIKDTGSTIPGHGGILDRIVTLYITCITCDDQRAVDDLASLNRTGVF